MQTPTQIANYALTRIGEDIISSIDDTDDANSVLCKQFYDNVWEELLMEYPWSSLRHRVEAQKEVTIDVANAATGDVVEVNDTELEYGVGWSSAATLSTAIDALDNVSASYSGNVVTLLGSLDEDLVVTKSESTGKVVLSSDYDLTDYRYTFPDYAMQINRIFDSNGLDITSECEIRNSRIFSDENYVYVEYISSYGILLATYGSGSPNPESYLQHLAALLLASRIAFRITQNVNLANSLMSEYQAKLAEAKSRSNPTRARNTTSRWIDEG